MSQRKGETREEWLARDRERRRRRYEDPAYRAAQCAREAERRADPEYNAKHRAARQLRDSAPEAKEARRAYTRRCRAQVRAWLVAALGGRCALCGAEKALCIDHDHTSGAVRGILCTGCNSSLGALERGRYGRAVPGWEDAARAYLARERVVYPDEEGA